MSSKKILALVSVLTFSVAGAAMASDMVDCGNAKYRNRDECVRTQGESVNKLLNQSQLS